MAELEGQHHADMDALKAVTSSTANVVSLELDQCDFRTDHGNLAGASLDHAVSVLDMSGARCRPADIAKLVHSARRISTLTAVDLSHSALSDENVATLSRLCAGCAA